MSDVQAMEDTKAPLWRIVRGGVYVFEGTFDECSAQAKELARPFRFERVEGKRK